MPTLNYEKLFFDIRESSFVNECSTGDGGRLKIYYASQKDKNTGKPTLVRAVKKNGEGKEILYGVKGQPILEVGLKHGKPYGRAKMFDKNGNELKDVKVLVQEAFGLTEGESTSLLDVDGGFVVAGVEKVSPRGYKPFDTVRSDVAKLWQREQQKTALTKTAEEVLNSVQSGKGWKGYTPITSVISQSESGTLDKAVADKLLGQKVGPENAVLFPTDKGTLVAYVKRIIPSKEEPTTAEKQAAVQEWAVDLGAAVQQVYAQKYPVEVHTNTIQKAFSIYENQEE